MFYDVFFMAMLHDQRRNTALPRRALENYALQTITGRNNDQVRFPTEQLAAQSDQW
jgi:hypothetical protein